MDELVALGPPKFLAVAGTSSPLVSEDTGNATAGVQIDTWTDLSGSGNNATQSTDAAQPTAVSSGYGGDPELQLAGAQQLVLPTAVLSAKTAFTIFFVGGKTDAATQQTLLAGDDTDVRIRWVSGTTLAVCIGGFANRATLSDNYDDLGRLYCIVFDGAGSDNSERLRIRIDGQWREVAYAGTIPAAVPTISTALHLFGYAGTENMIGAASAKAIYDTALSEADIIAAEAALGALVPWVADIPELGTALTESFETISDAGAVTEGATGVTLTPGSAVQVVAGTGGVHRAFPGMIRTGSTTRVGYRKAADHGYQADALIAYKDSADDGATFGSETTVLDTAGVDDREARFWDWSGVQFGTYLYTEDAMQAIAGPMAGPHTSVAGFPLDTRSRIHTNRPIGYDTNKYVLNGSQWPFSGPGTIRRIGLVDKTGSPGSIRWIEHDSVHFDECGIARVDGSTLVMVVRAQTLADYSVTDFLRLLRSTDDGATWTCSTFTVKAAGPNVFYHADSGLLVAGFREYADAGVNVYVSIIWSDDAGATWSDPIRLTPAVGNDCGYPDFCATSDPSTFLVAYYTSAGTFVVPVVVT